MIARIVCLLLSMAAVAADAAVLRGRVTDSSGGPLSGVVVELKAVPGRNSVVVTGANGGYATDLPAGTYEVTFGLPGFAPVTMRVRVDDPVALDAVLHPASAETVVVTARPPLREMPRTGEALTRHTDSASSGSVTADDIRGRPLQRSGDVLEAVPGLAVSQHSGEGKANQYYLRGFNLDHGTDVAISVAGIPVNLPTHAHGHGYADTNFLIPELLAGIHYRKGPYFADAGDFASAGSADIDYRTRLEKPIALVEAGSFGRFRSLVAASEPTAGGDLLYAAEWSTSDGPWTKPDDHRRLNGVLRFSKASRGRAFNVMVMAYDARWNAADQIPQRAVGSGVLSRFGLVDESNGGSTRRMAVAMEWQKASASRLTRITAYGLDYRLRLFSNFTYFLNDPVNGDQFEQAEDRRVLGLRGTHRWTSTILGAAAEYTAGAQARTDAIDDLGLFRTRARQRLGTTRQDDVRQLSAAAFAQSAVQWSPVLRTVAGVRMVHYRFDVRSHLDVNSGQRAAALVTPHVSLVAGPFAGTEIFANAGGGFHSNDGRGTTASVDPVSLQGISTVDPLVRTRGGEIGIRTMSVPRTLLTAALWTLDIDSELLFVGDAGVTDATRPSHRRGVEITATSHLTERITLDAEYAWSRARFSDADPAGAYIPGAVAAVASAGVSVELRRMTANLRLRHVGPRPLIEDGSVRSNASTLLSGRASYRWNARITLDLDVFNLTNSAVSDIDYFYTSRLPGEAAEGVDDVHFHPVVPRSVRVAVRTTF